MATRTTTRIVGALVGATALAAFLGQAADARILPIEETEERAAAVSAPVAGAAAGVVLRKTGRRVKTRVFGINPATADVFERAVLRRMRA